MSEGLRVGAGRAVITPPIGTILYGYAPGRPAESVGDDLTATAIAVQAGETSAMMITATICAFNAELCDRIRALVQDSTGIPARHVTVSATHTHSGPNTSIRSGWGEVDYEYIESILIPGILKAAKAAFGGMQPARMGVATTQCDVGINRRELRADGTVALGQNPWGPYDPTMTVISFKGDDDTIIANLIHYCAHCTGAGCNPEITRDWAGPMIDRLDQQSGGISAFFNGAEGDLGPRLANGRTTGDLQLAYELGGRAAIDAVRAWRSIRHWYTAEVGVLADEIRIPYNPLPSREEAQAEIDRIGNLDEWEENYKKYSAQKEVAKWRSVLAQHESDEPVKTHYVCRQSIVSIGPVAFVPFPFEMFVELTLRIRKDSPYQHTLSLSNTNGSHGYFPSQDQLCRGGYEIWSFKSSGAYSMVDDADTHAVQENLRLLNASHTNE